MKVRIKDESDTPERASISVVEEADNESENSGEAMDEEDIGVDHGYKRNGMDTRYREEAKKIDPKLKVALKQVTRTRSKSLKPTTLRKKTVVEGFDTSDMKSRRFTEGEALFDGTIEDDTEVRMGNKRMWTIQAIRDIDVNKDGNVEIEIKWLNYKECENTWEPLDNLDMNEDNVELLQVYIKDLETLIGSEVIGRNIKQMKHKIEVTKVCKERMQAYIENDGILDDDEEEEFTRKFMKLAETKPGSKLPKAYSFNPKHKVGEKSRSRSKEKLQKPMVNPAKKSVANSRQQESSSSRSPERVKPSNQKRLKKKQISSFCFE